MSTTSWQALPFDEWKDTYATLHMWTQVVGKIALASAPPLNHSWGVAFHLTPRGMSTSLLPHHTRPFAIQFDFVSHRLIVDTCDGHAQVLPLVSQSVAEFYKAVMSLLERMGLGVRVWSMPVEISDPIRFEDDTVHASYDAEAANRFWRILVQVERVLTDTRCDFIGKASPVHFFWGGMDMAVTRFSGRPAPAREGPAFMREAYSQEVISHGFWPGSAPMFEPAFYGYAVPEPPGLKEARVEPGDAYYHKELGEFVLPYEAVRRSADPDAAIRSFVNSTYGQAAALGHWDRQALERQTA